LESYVRKAGSEPRRSLTVLALLDAAADMAAAPE
jgi:hypothetical protein